MNGQVHRHSFDFIDINEHDPYHKYIFDKKAEFLQHLIRLPPHLRDRLLLPPSARHFVQETATPNEFYIHYESVGRNLYSVIQQMNCNALRENCHQELEALWTQAWHDAVVGVAQLHDLDFVHGCFHPSVVFFTGDKGQAKLYMT